MPINQLKMRENMQHKKYVHKKICNIFLGRLFRRILGKQKKYIYIHIKKNIFYLQEK